MALVRKKLTSLPRRRVILVLRMLLVPLGAYALDLLAALVRLRLGVRLPLQVIALGTVYCWLRKQSVNLSILSAGISAERRAARLLNRLPDTCNVFSDLTLRAGHETAQLDHLLITPCGIFVLEDKSWKGTLQGDGNQQVWTLKKLTKGGRGYEKQVPSPFRQLDRQVRVVKRLVHQVGREIPVSGVLFLPHAEAQVLVDNQRHQVVVGEQVLKLVKSRQAVLGKHQVDVIVNLVNSSM